MYVFTVLDLCTASQLFSLESLGERSVDAAQYTENEGLSRRFVMFFEIIFFRFHVFMTLECMSATAIP